jgi:hypothetical protein
MAELVSDSLRLRSFHTRVQRSRRSVRYWLASALQHPVRWLGQGKDTISGHFGQILHEVAGRIDVASSVRKGDIAMPQPGRRSCLRKPSQAQCPWRA